ncbi:MAG TPA: hypothetical protein VJI52_02555 [Candidatus Nanoarchaeia archaeon]|nr:hypothetical protein [Candidatus Nanoarchaeia archaeon]
MNKNKVKMQLVLISLMLVIFSAAAYSAEDEFAEAKSLIDTKTPCLQLSESQMELIGDYYMEQMHPGTAHTAMEQMMGGEGSESLRLMHIAIAKRVYCNDYSSSANYGMMGFGMVGNRNGGMMNMALSGMMGSGTMGGYSYGLGYWSFVNVLYLLLLVGLIVLVYLWIVKIWRGLKIGKGSKK